MRILGELRYLKAGMYTIVLVKSTHIVLGRTHSQKRPKESLDFTSESLPLHRLLGRDTKSIGTKEEKCTNLN